MNRSVIEISALSKTYSGSNSIKTEALRNIDLIVNDGELLCIVGKSGCGKSTLLNIIAGIIQPTEGQIKVFGDHPVKVRQKISYIQQRAQLLSYRTVLQNAVLGMELRNSLTTENLKRTYELLSFLGLNGFSRHYPHELSGGMQQRVALARTLAVDSSMLLCDEPFVSLDFDTRLELEDLFWQTVKDKKKTSVFVTHDIESAVALGDRIAIMSPRPGSIFKIISVDEEISQKQPLSRRQSSVFSKYFSEVWQKLRKVQENYD